MLPPCFGPFSHYSVTSNVEDNIEDCREIIRTYKLVFYQVSVFSITDFSA